MIDNSRTGLAVVGLGKLGLPWACLLASKGYRVDGIDCDHDVVHRLRQQTLHSHEPELEQLFANATPNLSIHNHFDNLRQPTMGFVVVPTPSAEDHRFSLQYVLPAVRSLVRAAVARELDPFTIVVVSTVMPGDCHALIWPAVVEESASRRGAGLSLAYCPEFVALGNVVHGMRCPELLLIGADSPATQLQLTGVYHSVVDNQPRTHLTTLLNAEIAKLALNGMLAMKITYANLLAQLCQRLDGANVDNVTSVLASDSRIGGKYLTGGMGFGGPCLPRDMRALAALCQQCDVTAEIANSVSDFNDSLPATIADWVLEACPSDLSIGVVGLAYTMGTDVVEGSQTIALVDTLLSRGVQICAYDPHVSSAHGNQAWEDISWCRSLSELLSRVHTVIATGRDEGLYQCDPLLLKNRTVFDCWRSATAWRELASSDMVPGLRYFGLGAGKADPVLHVGLR